MFWGEQQHRSVDLSMSVCLVGMPGSGKSTVGRQLARLLGWQLLDSDAEIERELGHSIRSHFEQHGEDSFRALEEAMIAKLAAPGVVLATGAVPSCEANRQALKGHGNTVVYLRASVDDLRVGCVTTPSVRCCRTWTLRFAPATVRAARSALPRGGRPCGGHRAQFRVCHCPSAGHAAGVGGTCRSGF
jgi:hypothetical protein